MGDHGCVECRFASLVDPLAELLEFFRRQLRNRRFDFLDRRRAFILTSNEPHFKTTASMGPRSRERGDMQCALVEHAI